MIRDTGRSAVYDTEHMVWHMFNAGGSAQLAGTTVTIPPEARFGSVEAARMHVERILARESIRERFPRAALPLVVRERKGSSKAHYEPGSPATIALPVKDDGRWALRELVLLHELAHHLDDVRNQAHGPGFTSTLVDLVADVIGPEAGFIYRVMFAESDVPVG